MKTSLDQIFDLLNADNSPPYPLTQLNVNVVDGPTPEVSDGWNTKLTLDSIPGGGYVGHADVFYKRIDLQALGTDVEVSSEAAFTLATLVDAINASTGSFLEVTDLENFVIPPMDTGVVGTITIRAVVDSIGWTGTRDVLVIIGLPASASILHTLLHTTMPSPGYW